MREELAALLWLFPGFFLTSDPLSAAPLWRDCRLSRHSSLLSKPGAESRGRGTPESLTPPVLPAERRKGAGEEGLETLKE